jgi:hypothetical protein
MMASGEAADARASPPVRRPANKAIAKRMSVLIRLVLGGKLLPIRSG